MNEIKEPLLPYYVYALLNPLKGNVPFYIGKGTGHRVRHHLKEVERRLKIEAIAEDEITQSEKQLESQKMREISDILKSGKQPLEIIIGRFETEDEAYAVEATLIHFVYGHAHLTNIASGHGSDFIRTRYEFEFIQSMSDQQDILLKPGIDIEDTVGLRDGSFKNEKIKGLTEAQAYEQLVALQDALTDAHIVWRDFADPSDKRFHPGESNGYLAIIARIKGIDFNLQFTKSKIISIQIIYTQSTQVNLDVALEKLTRQTGITLSPPKAGKKYSWLLPKIESSDTDLIIKKLKIIEMALDS